MTLLDVMQADTLLLIDEWETNMSYCSPVISTDIPPVTTWGTSRTFTGDWQPYSKREDGGVIEQGIDQHYDYRIFTTYDLAVKIGDKISNTDDGISAYVKKILNYKDHLEILATINLSS